MTCACRNNKAKNNKINIKLLSVTKKGNSATIKLTAVTRVKAHPWAE